MKPGLKSAAFSLIEIVLALGIISFALVGIMGLFPVAMMSAQESQRETRAAHIAKQIFTDLTSLPGTNRILTTGTNFATDRVAISLSTAGTNTVYFDSEGSPLGVVISADATFDATVTVSPDNPFQGISLVQTMVSTPAAAPETNRSHYTFVTLLNLR